MWKAASVLMRAEGLKIPPLGLVGITLTSLQSFDFLSGILQSLRVNIQIYKNIPAEVCSAATQVCFYIVIIFVVVKKSNRSSQ